VTNLKREIAGFETRREGNMLLLARGALRELLAGRPVSDLLAGSKETVEGRRTHSVVELPGGTRAVVRHYTHGGLLRKVTSDRFAGSERFFTEVRVSEHLRRRGVNTPEVLGLLVQAGKLGFRRGALVTRMVEGGQDLLVYLRSEDGVRQLADPRTKRALIRSTARQVRKMHDAGVCHADLHVKNLLLAPAGRIFILDLDRAKVHGELGLSRRLANLIRLGRSLEKTGTDSVISGRDTYVFFLEYLRCGAPLKIDPREVVKKYRRHVARHRLFWKLGIH
jgi:tRNA A-37 threonylcarbamoyl transferase component Bud32